MNPLPRHLRVRTNLFGLLDERRGLLAAKIRETYFNVGSEKIKTIAWVSAKCHADGDLRLTNIDFGFSRDQTERAMKTSCKPGGKELLRIGPIAGPPNALGRRSSISRLPSSDRATPDARP
jgi:hypothetical protein